VPTIDGTRGEEGIPPVAQDSDLPPWQRRPENPDFAAASSRIDEAIASVEKLLAELPEPQQQPGAQEAGPPDEVTDVSGSIRVLLAADGLPRAIEVAPDWRRTVGCDGLADAVNTACVFAAAAGRAPGPAEPTGRPNDDLLAEVAKISAAVDQALDWASRGTAPRDSTAPDGLREMWEAADLRPGRVDEFMDQVLRASEAAERSGQAPMETDISSPANGKLSLHIEMFGVVTCAVNPDWVNQQDHESLNAALASALAAARAEHGPAEHRPSPAGGPLWSGR
jgi:hypothetical protein